MVCHMLAVQQAMHITCYMAIRTVIYALIRHASSVKYKLSLPAIKYRTYELT